MAAPSADTKKELDAAFTAAIEKINLLIEKTKELKAAYGKEPAATTEELKPLKDAKKALSTEVQAKLAEINRMLGAPPAAVAEEAAPDAAAAAAAAAAASSSTPAQPAPTLAPPPGGASVGGGRKPAKKTAGKPKRAQKGGSDAAIAPSDAVPTSVYNIQGLMTQNHNPYLVASDANIAAMSRIHAPFSAGVVGDVNQQTTAELSTALVGRMTPQPPMAGGAKRKSAKTGAAKKR
jgi:hypothetical protein